MLAAIAMGVTDRIVAHAERLTSTERRIAEVLAHEPEVIAFGTVAEVAKRSGTSGPSVVRLASKLGYEGFVGLQADVQADMARRLGPARERIREKPPGDLLDQAQAAELDNVARTIRGIDADALQSCARRLADRRHKVWVLAGMVTAPVGAALSTQLGQLRDGVSLLGGSEAAVGRELAGLQPGDTLITVDIRRYERSLVSLSRWAGERGAIRVAVTDSPLSPLAAGAQEMFFIAAQGVGPFDSMAAGVALANVMAAATAAKLRRSATARLDAIESAWASAAALVARPAGEGVTPP